MDKRTLSTKSIAELLACIAMEKRLSYDKAHMEALYLAYQRNEVADVADLEALGRELAGRKVLLVGPGRGTIGHEDSLRAFVAVHKPLVIAINHIPEVVEADAVFVSNSKRYVQLADPLHRGQGRGRLRLIATSNVTCTHGRFDFLLNYSSLLLDKGAFPDNSLIMLLKVLMRIGVSWAALAGFDGYGAGRATNYAHAEMEYPFTDELAAQVNRDVSDFLDEAEPVLSVEFLTDSLYRPRI
jgi:4-hydroxy 2-oxovalerate aldolase